MSYPDFLESENLKIWSGLFYSFLSAKQCILVFGKRGEKHHSKDTAGDDLTSAYSKHHKRDREVGAISVTKNEWYQDCVCNDWRNWCEPFAAASELIGKYSSDEGGNASECDIQRNCAAKHVGQDAAYKKARDGSWCEKWENR